MTKTASDPAAKLGWLASMWQQIKLVWRLFTDKRVPPWLKAIPIVGVIYVVSPFDFIPEAITGPLGLIDDPALLALAFKLFIDWSPAAVVAEHRTRLAGIDSDGWNVAGADAADSAGKGKSTASDDDIIDAELVN
jgi:uncharacterized membrane protein YkvA (DUF1232 family)